MADFDKLLKEVGQRIRLLRKRQNLTQMDLSEKAGIADVGDIERGSANATLYSLYKISKALGVEIRDLFDFPGLGEPLKEEEKIEVEIRRVLKGEGLATQQKALKMLRALLE